MPTQFPPPPTYQLPIEQDAHGQAVFNPAWLEWFNLLGQVFTSIGAGGGGALNHNALGNLQGGDSPTDSQMYHLNAAQYSAATTWPAPSVITPTGSPMTVNNTSAARTYGLLVAGGTGVSVQWSRDGVTYYPAGSSGEVLLSPGDFIKITYTGAPTLTYIPR